MDEGTKQKVMIGVLVVAVGGILAINFWPEGSSSSTDEGFAAPTRKQREAAEEAPKEFEVQREEAQEEEAVEQSRRRPSEEEGSASIRRKTAPKAEKDTVVPAA